jgi:hypothetical protein
MQNMVLGKYTTEFNHTKLCQNCFYLYLAKVYVRNLSYNAITLPILLFDRKEGFNSGLEKWPETSDSTLDSEFFIVPVFVNNK